MKEPLKMDLHKEQPGDAIEHNWTKAAAGSEEQSVEAEMPLPDGGRVQQSAASPQLMEQQPAEPDRPYRYVGHITSVRLYGVVFSFTTVYNLSLFQVGLFFL